LVDDNAPLPEVERLGMARLLSEALHADAKADEMIAAARAWT
jgi:hypothetical protein